MFDKIKSYFVELYRYRSVIRSQIRKEMVTKYKKTYLGVLWNVLTPLLFVLLIGFVMGKFMEKEIEDYWVYLLSGFFAFRFIRQSITSGSNAITGHSRMITKKKFSMEILVIADCISSILVVIIDYIVVILAIAICGELRSTVVLIQLPILFVLMTMFSYGIELLVSAICTIYRDVQFFVQATVRVLFWITPVAYSTEQMGSIGALLYMNPLTSFVQLFQSIIYFGKTPSLQSYAFCFIVSIVFIIVGHLIFNHYKNYFAEVV